MHRLRDMRRSISAFCALSCFLTACGRTLPPAPGDEGTALKAQFNAPLPAPHASPFVNLGNVTASGINNVASVVGTHPFGATQHAFIYSNGSLQDLGALGGASFFSSGAALNNVTFGKPALATGQSENAASQGEAFLWSGTNMIARGGATTWGSGIDTVGDIAGRVSSGGQAYAIAWLADGTILKPIDTTLISGANAIVSYSLSAAVTETDVAGFWIPSSNANGFYTAFNGVTWNNVSILPLSGDTTLVPRALNDSRVVVGDSRSTTQTHAFAAFIQSISPPNAKVAQLPTLGGAQADALSINRFGAVAGWAQTATNQTHAVLWRPFTVNGSTQYKAYDLNALAPSGWTLGSSAGLNDSYQITGNGASGPTSQGFILPVNENAMDVSVYSGKITTAIYANLKNVNSLLRFVVVSVWQPSGKPNPFENSQLDNATSAQLDTAAYLFLNYTSSGTVQMNNALTALGGKTSPRVQGLRFIGIDVEKSAYDGSSSGVKPSDRVGIIEDAIKAAPAGKQIIIYTTSGHWAGLTGTTPTTNPFRMCPLWDAQPDTLPDLLEHLKGTQMTLWAPYGGWTATTHLGKQYEFNTGADAMAIQNYLKVPSVDLDVFDWQLPFDNHCVGGSAPTL